LSQLHPDTLADRTPDLLDPMAAQRATVERARDEIRKKFGSDAIIKGRSLR
jgi:DNA polymerase-4